MKIANTATPRIRLPLPRSNEKAESSASVISVPATIASPSADREQDQHVGVAQLAAAHDRVAGDQRGEDQRRRARIAVSSGGKSGRRRFPGGPLCSVARLMRILILGGDGYLGWPTAMRFSDGGHEVRSSTTSPGALAYRVSTDSLTPIGSLADRIEAWRESRATRSARSWARSRTSASSTR